MDRQKKQYLRIVKTPKTTDSDARYQSWFDYFNARFDRIDSSIRRVQETADRIEMAICRILEN